MASPVERIEELENFLRPYRLTSGPRYRSAYWLKNSFDDPAWQIHLNIAFSINWGVQVAGGDLLTSTRHYPLWEAFRSWLVVQTHVDVTGGKPQSELSDRRAIQRTLRCIDYFLLHSQRLGLADYHMAAITPNDLHAALVELSSSGSTHEAVYAWSTRLATFLRDQITHVSRTGLERLLRRVPLLSEGIPERNDFLTDLTHEELIKARAWLYENHIYTRRGAGFQFCPSTRRLAKLVYPNTIWGCNRMFPIPIELGIGPEHYFQTEFPRSRVTGSEDRRLCKRDIRKLVDTFRSLQLLKDQGITVPEVPASLSSPRAFDGKNSKRFRTLPHSVVMSALRRAVEFVIEFGDPLVDSYLRLARSAEQSGRPVAAHARLGGVSAHLDPKVASLGVQGWSIEPLDAGLPSRTKPLSKSEYFVRLRSNRGLYECLRVLYGAVSIIVGTVMARRQGEILDLIAGKCFDVSGTRLLFRNRKSGFLKLRKLEARPIPRIGARAIELLERLQIELVDAGILKHLTRLFAYPKQYGTEPLLTLTEGVACFNGSIDIFCDWAEVALDRDGCRHYIRQHQLRRFFAMLFFWGGGIGGMDTLRWFLGHTDVEHLWHYITEFTPGATLRSIAAEWVAYGVKHATKEAEILGAEISFHFGTADFSIIEEAALVEYIEDLIEDGRLSVEPQFLDGGRAYRIAVLLDQKETLQ